MANPYYNEKEIAYPPVLRAILASIKDYTASLLYPVEYAVNPQDTIKNRVIFSDVGAGETISIGDGIERFKSNLGQFPLTAYQMGDTVLRDWGTTWKGANTQDGYSEEFDCYVSTFPLEITINMVSFFPRASDYRRANTLLMWDKALLTRLPAPILINNKLTAVPYDLDWEIEKGEFTDQFEKFLSDNRITSIVHNAVVRAWDLIIDPARVNHVDTIELGLFFENEKNNKTLLQAIQGYPALEVVSNFPSNGAVDMPADIELKVVFNNAMQESTVEDLFSIAPYVPGRFSWSEDSKTLTYTFDNALDSKKTYHILIPKSVKDGNNMTLGEDLAFSFTTV